LSAASLIACGVIFMQDLAEHLPQDLLQSAGVAYLRQPGAAKMPPSGYFREILEVLPVPIYMADREGRIVYYNPAAVALWGCCPELGKSEWSGAWRLLKPDGTPMPHDQCPMAVAIRERRPVRGAEAIAERPDGTRVAFLPHPTPIYDEAGEFVGAVNMLLETGDRRRADEYADRLASIVESSDDAIASKNLDGIVTSWNIGAERLFGYTAAEMIGKPIVLLIPPERADEEPKILQRIRSGERIDHYETVRRRKDGTLIDVSLTVSPIKNAEGKVVGASKIARNITEAKRAREQQHLLLNEMKHRVKNTLATVQAIAMQTMHSASPEDRTAFVARLNALAGAHDMLTKSWDRANVRDIVEGALGPFQEEHRERFLIEGPESVLVEPQQSLLLAMGLHELATNAAKYGALSNRSGRVRVSWAVRDREGDTSPRLFLEWLERGGPAVEPPKHKGFGSRLIERALNTQEGAAAFRFDPQGLTCTLSMLL
jgi:PAS domain S-box-containing protein